MAGLERLLPLLITQSSLTATNNLEQISRDYRDALHHIVVAGDFNQNRDGRGWYGAKKGRQDLGGALEGANLACATEGVIESIEEGNPLNPMVDHICLDRALVRRAPVVRGWPSGETPGGKRLTDHTGEYVDVKLR